MSRALKIGAAAVAGYLLISVTSGGTGHSHQAAVRYAEAHLGDPYVWGAAGPDEFDCSGLAEAAEAAAGITIERTSQEQWATLRHVTRPKPGDLVFFVGEGDGGTMTAPGHVAIVVNARKKLMIDAPSPGGFVREESWAGWPGLVGFADPADH